MTKRLLYTLAMACAASQLFWSCRNAGQSTESENATASGAARPTATRPAVTKASLSPEIEYQVLRADLLRVSSNSAFDARYEALLSDPLKEKYSGWGMEAGSRLSTTGRTVPQSGTRFAQLLVEFVNVGTKPARLDVSPSDGKGLDLALVLPTGKEVDAWEFLGSDWFPDYESLEDHLARHGDEIAVQVAFEGRLYCEIDPGQRSWLALLFELPATGDLSGLKLRIKDETVDVLGNSA